MDIRWDLDDKTAWQIRLARQPYCALRQDWAFGEAMRHFGTKVGRAVVTEGRQDIAAAQVMQRRGIRLIGQGPIWLRDIDPEQKRRVIRKLSHHCGATIVTPNDALNGWGLIPLITPASSALWQIDTSPDQLRQGLHGKWRNRLIKAEALVVPKTLRGPALQALIAEEAKQRYARGYRNLPGNLAMVWPDETYALGWYRAGTLHAGMVFLIHQQSASYFIGWASPLARSVFAHGPMLWQTALALRGQGVRHINLGDVNTESGPGLARFKLGTGAVVVTAGATCLALPLP